MPGAPVILAKKQHPLNPSRPQPQRRSRWKLYLRPSARSQRRAAAAPPHAEHRCQFPPVGTPRRRREQGSSKREPSRGAGAADEAMTLPTSSTGAAACQSVLSVPYIPASEATRGAAVPPAARRAGSTRNTAEPPPGASPLHPKSNQHSLRRPWELRSTVWLDLRLYCLGPAQHSCRRAKTSSNRITIAPIAFRRAFTELSISAVCTPIKTIRNTVRWGRNTMNFHHIGISGTIYIVTMSLMRRSNKYPLQSSYYDGWERKQRPKRCHILETWPGKKDPQLTRWVRDSLGLSKALWLS